MLDDLWREAMAEIADFGHPCRLTRHHVDGIRFYVTMPITGTVKFFNASKDFGFIQPDVGEEDVFVHVTALEAAGLRSLKEGDKVSFVAEDDRQGRGKQAAQIEME